MYSCNIQKRKAMRLRNYNYNQAGAYFITICIQNRECLLGEIREGNLYLNDYGKIVEQVWNQLPDHFSNKIEIDAAVVMPNHFHGIIVNCEDKIKANIKEQPIFYHQKTQLGNVIAYFKYQTTKLINQKRNMAGVKIWQRNYYDHIIRNQESLAILQKYVIENPLRWTNDQLYPDNVF